MKKMLSPCLLLVAALSMLSCAQAPPANTTANTNAAPAPSATAATETAAKKAPTDLEQLA